MPARFAIIETFKVQNRGCFVLVRILDEKVEFQLSKNSKLGTVKIAEWKDVPRKIGSDGKQEQGVFIFKLENESQENELKSGEILTLNSSDF